MDPFFRLQQPGEGSPLPERIVKRIRERHKDVVEGITRVQRASGLSYPPHYIEPSLPVASSAVETGELGLLFARTFPALGPAGLAIWVQISAPLVLYASKGTLHAVLAHEFLHYAELVRRFTSLDLLSEQLSSTLFEASYADQERALNPSALLKDAPLIRLIKKKFPKVLADPKLEEKTANQWIKKSLPITRMTPDSNVISIPVERVLAASFDPLLKMKLDGIERPPPK